MFKILLLLREKFSRTTINKPNNYQPKNMSKTFGINKKKRDFHFHTLAPPIRISKHRNDGKNSSKAANFLSSAFASSLRWCNKHKLKNVNNKIWFDVLAFCCNHFWNRRQMKAQLPPPPPSPPLPPPPASLRRMRNSLNLSLTSGNRPFPHRENFDAPVALNSSVDIVYGRMIDWEQNALLLLRYLNILKQNTAFTRLSNFSTY